MTSLGVEVRTNARVAEVRADGVVLSSGELIPSELVVWSAGVKAPDFLADFDGLEVNRINQLVVDTTLQTTRDPHIFAIGDCASCPREGYDAPVPPRAQAAHQMATHIIRHIEEIMKGEPIPPFDYRDFGSLVSLGKYSAVGNVMGYAVGHSMFIEGAAGAADVSLALQDARSRSARPLHRVLARAAALDRRPPPDAEREAALSEHRHCEERSDEAIQGSTFLRPLDCLRFARNDESNRHLYDVILRRRRVAAASKDGPHAPWPHPSRLALRASTSG